MVIKVAARENRSSIHLGLFPGLHCAAHECPLPNKFLIGNNSFTHAIDCYQSIRHYPTVPNALKRGIASFKACNPFGKSQLFG